MDRKIAKTLIMTLLIGTTALAGCLGNGDENDASDLESLVIAFSIKDDYTNVDENPQRFADYLGDALNMDVSLYPIDSEGAALQALRFGNADIALMDGGAAWVGWQQYGLEALAADQKSDGRTYYSAHAVVLKDSEIAAAHLDDDPSTDPFSLMAGKTSCHTGWLKSAGMLLPMGFLIGNGYANVIGDANDVESLRSTITNFFNEDASIPDSGTPYYSYSGAVKCLSEGVGDVAFAKDSTINAYCGNEDASANEAWCLPESDYILLPSYGNAPSHPVMYNPQTSDSVTMNLVQDVLVNMAGTDEGKSILENVLNTPAISATTASEHLASYGNLIEDVPGISAYYDTKFSINDSIEPTISNIRIAFEMKDDYTNPAETLLKTHRFWPISSLNKLASVSHFIRFLLKALSSKHFASAMQTSPSWTAALLGLAGKNTDWLPWLLISNRMDALITMHMQSFSTVLILQMPTSTMIHPPTHLQ